MSRSDSAATGMGDGCFSESGGGGGAVVWQSGTTARHNSESLFSLDFCSSVLPFLLPTGLPSLYLFSCFETDCLLPSQRHLVLID